MKFALANTNNIWESDIVVMGVPDESGSDSYRKGSSKGPDAIRKVSNQREIFERRGKKILSASQTGPIKKKVFDYGNVSKSIVSSLAHELVSKGKIIATLGGDHSVTAEVLKGVDKAKKRVSVVYFDAHPDFICSSKSYYGSVICDIRDYKNIDFSSSIEVGIRQPEPEELANIRRMELETIMPVEIAEKGLGFALKKIKKTVGKNIYVSIDMDVLDPGFAPGVSTPVPGGLSTLQLIYLMKEISKVNLVGFDIVEVCPKYDVNDMTSHIATRLIAETVSSLR